MKEVLDEAGVPTARFGVFDEPAEAMSFLRRLPGPWVVKTDGLAAGKGVLVTADASRGRGRRGRPSCRGEAFGDAGRRVVIEEGLAGSECSLLVALRRAPGGPPGPGPGLQAHRRRRRRAQHRRDGRLLPGARIGGRPRRPS